MSRVITVFTIIIAALILLVVAMYNGYPLFTSDSGAYIEAFHTHHLPADRPITYSVFVFLSSLYTSLLLVVLFQSVILSLVIYLLFKIIFPASPVWIFFLLILLLTGFTNISWFSSQIMPDIFTPLIFLATMVYVSSRNILEKIFCGCIIFFSVLMHNANFITAICFYITFLLASFIPIPLKISKSSFAQLLAVSVFAVIAICSLHWATGNGFRPSKGSHVFLIGKLAENGILKKYLDENCIQHNYKLCDFKDHLPKHAWDFVWDNDGAFQKTGGWDSSSIEYNHIIKSISSSPKYIWLLILESIKAPLPR